MEDPSLKPIIRVFENLFSKLNREFFDGELIPPVIVISPEGKAGASGWCTTWKAWKNMTLPERDRSIRKNEVDSASDERINKRLSDANEDEGYYEISLSAEYLSNGNDKIIGTLLHEMVHLYNLQNGIKDTSRSGYYHNKTFKESAEAHGLVAEKVEGSGYSKTRLSEEAANFVKRQDKVHFNLFRTADTRQIKKKQKVTVHRYVCPTCGDIVRATKVVHVGCLDCGCAMVEQENKDEDLGNILLSGSDNEEENTI